MRQVSINNANLVSGKGWPKSRYVYVVFSALLAIVIILTLLNVTRLFSKLINVIERFDGITFSLSSERSNTLAIDSVAEDEITNIKEPVEVNSFAINEGKDGSAKINKIVKSEQGFEKKAVTVDRDVDAIINDLFHSYGDSAHRFLDELWRRAGDLQVPNEALVALEQIVMSGDESLAKKAEFALNDLLRYKARLEKEKYQKRVTVSMSSSQYDQPGKYSKGNEQVSFANYGEIVLDEIKPMLYSHENLNRSMAVDKLNLLRTPEALSLLINVSSQEYDSKIRYKVIRGIWMYTADGVGNGVENLDILRRAVQDEDQSITNLARSALEDLNKLQSSLH